MQRQGDEDAEQTGQNYIAQKMGPDGHPIIAGDCRQDERQQDRHAPPSFAQQQGKGQGRGGKGDVS